jgi:SLOG cluster3 family
MAKQELKNIFLSASIPLKERDEKYFNTADIIAIRDSVIALTTVVLPNHRLIWGGHPSITPIIYHIMQRLGLNIQEHVTLYQSLFFEKYFPEDNNKFQNVILTDNKLEKEASLLLMRKRMFTENSFVAGIFIGGMEGIEDEFKLFRELQPQAFVLPIASTGAASQIVYDNYLSPELKNKRLENDYAYMSLFQDLLIDKI